MSDFKNQIDYLDIDFSDLENTINKLNIYLGSIPMVGLGYSEPREYYRAELEKLK